MGPEAIEVVQRLANLAHHNRGLALIETWMCLNCGEGTFAIHAMQEVVQCLNCGHRHASKFPRYQAENEFLLGQK